MNAVNKRIAVTLAVGFVIGVVWLIGIRFALVEKDDVHYHANFAVYIHDQKQQFDSFAFYEEVQSCGADAAFNPKNRAHMHDEVNHVVHVHDQAVTWGHFLANLGFSLGDDFIQTGDGLFIEDDENKLIFWLNGKEVATIANQVIRSEDVLLIHYSNDNNEEVLQERYDSIVKDAAVYNTRQDPSACTGGKPMTFGERLKAAIGL